MYYFHYLLYKNILSKYIYFNMLQYNKTYIYVQEANFHLIRVLTMGPLLMVHADHWQIHLLLQQLTFLYLVRQRGLKPQTIVLILKVIFLMAALVVVVYPHLRQHLINQVQMLYEFMYHILHLYLVRTKMIFHVHFRDLQKLIESVYESILIKHQQWKI